MESNFIPLESIQIASPCHADWNRMAGDDRIRFCGSCEKNVYNFAGMTRVEAEKLIQEKEGNICVRMHRRKDGTILTSDCPIGISPVERSDDILRDFLISALAAILFGVGLRAMGNAVKEVSYQATSFVAGGLAP